MVDQIIRYNAFSAMYHPVLYAIAIFAASTIGSYYMIFYVLGRRGFGSRIAIPFVASFLFSVASGLLLLTYHPVASAFANARITLPLALARTLGSPFFFVGAAVNLIFAASYLAKTPRSQERTLKEGASQKRPALCATLLLGILMLGVTWSSASIAGLVYQFEPHYRFPERFVIHNSNNVDVSR